MPRVKDVPTHEQKDSSRRKAKPKVGLFSALRHVFLGPPEPKPVKAARQHSRRQSRSSSSLRPTWSRAISWKSATSTDGKSAGEKESWQDHESNCLAIRTARRDQIAVQKLLVDCEFCHPPPKYGIDIEIETPNLTAQDHEQSDKFIASMKNPDEHDECEWNVGYNEWLHIRKWWNTPTKNQVKPHQLPPEVTPDKYVAIYDKMVRYTRPLKKPMNLSDAVKIIKRSWEAEGTWPPPNETEDWWSSDDKEIIEARVRQRAREQQEREANREPVTPGSAKTGPVIMHHYCQYEDEIIPIRAPEDSRVQFEESATRRPLNNLRNQRSINSNMSGMTLHRTISTNSSILSFTDPETIRDSETSSAGSDGHRSAHVTSNMTI